MDPAALKAAIWSTRDSSGITGLIGYADESRLPRKGVTLIAVKGGKLTLAAEVVPETVPAP